MFQFSNLLSRPDAQRQRPRGDDRDLSTPRDDSVPESFRRELDEQMQRLNRLLDQVESLDDEPPGSDEPDATEPTEPRCIPKIFRGDSEPEAVIASDESAAVADCRTLPCRIEPADSMPAVAECTAIPEATLETAVFTPEVAIVPDLIFEAALPRFQSSPDDLVCIHTDEIPRCGDAEAVQSEVAEPKAVEPKAVEPTRGRTQNKPPAARSAHRNGRARPLQQTQKPSNVAGVSGPGLVQDFNHRTGQNDSIQRSDLDSEPALEIIEPLADPSDDVATKPPAGREPVTVTPGQLPAIELPIDDLLACATEINVPAQSSWPPLLVEAQALGSGIPQTISVTPPASAVVMLKQAYELPKRASVPVVPAGPDLTMAQAWRAPSPAAVAKPIGATAVEPVRPSPASVVQGAVKAVPVTPVQPAASAVVPQEPINSQWLNVLAVLGGLLALAALALVATDFAAWF